MVLSGLAELAATGRARQMVWIAVGLMAVSVILVAINTAAGRWSMRHWRFRSAMDRRRCNGRTKFK